MAWLSRLRSPHLTFLQVLFSLMLSLVSLLSSHWCSGVQKVPKPLCSSLRRGGCTPSDLFADGSEQFAWETGDDRFLFPTFHAGIWSCCEESIHTNLWEVKCRVFMALTPPSEKGIFWLCVAMELTFISLLSLSCLLLMVQLCLAAWKPAVHRWGELLNAFAAVFTVLGGLVGMVGHMMFMHVFQVTVSSGPKDFKPHRYGYSWAFYIAWLAFACCMAAGVSTLNNYTKKVLMCGTKPKPDFYPCRNLFSPRQISFSYAPAPPPHSSMPPPSAPPAPLSPLSPYFSPPSPPSFPPLSPPLVPPAPPSPHCSVHPALSPSPPIILSVSDLHTFVPSLAFSPPQLLHEECSTL